MADKSHKRKPRRILRLTKVRAYLLIKNIKKQLRRQERALRH